MTGYSLEWRVWSPNEIAKTYKSEKAKEKIKQCVKDYVLDNDKRYKEIEQSFVDNEIVIKQLSYLYQNGVLNDSQFEEMVTFYKSISNELVQEAQHRFNQLVNEYQNKCLNM